MKRKWTYALLALFALTVVAGTWALADDDGYYRGRGPGMMWGGGYGPGMMGNGYGPGMMGGYGPGMMGNGFGPGMMGFGMGPAMSQLPAEKQEQLRKLHIGAAQAMVPMMADMQAKMDALRDAMRAYPVDQAAAKKAFEAMGKARDQMFALHLATLAQAQQIVGKDAWDDMQDYGGWGRGHGPGMMGPDGRGPKR